MWDRARAHRSEGVREREGVCQGNVWVCAALRKKKKFSVCKEEAACQALTRHGHQVVNEKESFYPLSSSGVLFSRS